MAFRLAAVYAHPDDDTYSLAGTYALEEGRLDLTVVVATSGEAGEIADPSLATAESLGAVREREEREALATVAAGGASVHFLRYPDGALADVPSDDLVQAIEAVLRDRRPQVVATFGPEGVTKHPDHVAVHQAATEAFHRLQAKSTEGSFRRLFYSAVPKSLLERWMEAMRSAGIDTGHPDDPLSPRGVPDATITCRVDCGAVLGRKMAALRAHRTQGQELEAMPEQVRAEVLGSEFFVQAWPPMTEPGGPLLGSLFDGLEEG
jgi:LmbE family N-acetylglucosaminyl deacetylase